MHKFKLYTAEILKDLQTKMKTLNDNVFVGSRPDASKKQLDSMLVVSLPCPVRDKGYYQYSYVRIEVIVKNKAQGVEDITKLDSLSSSVIDMFPLQADDGRYKASSPVLTLKGKDDLGYTIWYIQANLYVNTTDSYIYTNTNN